MLFDFIVEELARREPEDPRRIRPVRIALQNQRDDLLGFAGVLDEKLVAIALAHEISLTIVREACVLHRFCRPPQLRTGKGGIGYGQGSVISSMCSSMPCVWHCGSIMA